MEARAFAVKEWLEGKAPVNFPEGRIRVFKHGDQNPVALYIPGHHAHGFEALTDLLFCYHVTAEFDASDPDEHGIPWNDPRVRNLWSTQTPILSARDAAAAS